VICRFLPYDVGQIVEIVRAVTGWDVDKWELLKVGERAATLSRMFNLREGITARDDRLPDRFFQPLKKGPLAGAFVDPDTLKSATQQYYREMGWDVEGKPTQHALEEWGIAYLARQEPVSLPPEAPG
jgi:aldehyde:ferredoxin oxidoreductase